MAAVVRHGRPAPISPRRPCTTEVRNSKSYKSAPDSPQSTLVKPFIHFSWAAARIINRGADRSLGPKAPRFDTSEHSERLMGRRSAGMNMQGVQSVALVYLWGRISSLDIVLLI